MSRSTVITDVTVVPGGGAPQLRGATVVLDADGIVTEIEATGPAGGRLLVPGGVDLHLDNLTERRRPRATVLLEQAAVLSVLDAECAAAGISTVCIAARCEDAPGKGVHIADAVALARVVEQLAPSLACDWRIHARVEVTDDAALQALEDVLGASTRVAIVSMMENSVERSRFATHEERRSFYAADWGVSVTEVDALMSVGSDDPGRVAERRAHAARLAHEAGAVLASHDDRHVADVEEGRALGATVSEFPLSLEAARHARAQGMLTVLGAPNAVRGRSTSSANVLVADAVAAGVVDVLCCDYLPFALQAAPQALAQQGVLPLERAVDLVSTAPARAIGLPSPEIVVGRPLTAALGTVAGTTFMGEALWRDGRQVFSRTQDRAPRLAAVAG
ncbi:MULTISPECIES: alpha-D-ribose 1-methylphosphonate 5-triphosphate diphosphatase [unclassified Modestobacter]